ncbi:DUF3560 domain-containing protein [Streptomyces sp. NPDC041068]|uniref:DUF3560 domain-containing protein n=1 Tax=Streptomyces sp. NPDC041068 TaxID=3155130 RepID=UPI003404ACC1
MTITITHTRSNGTLIHGTSKDDGPSAVLRTRDYPSGYINLARFSRNLGCWYLPHSRDKQAPKGMLEALTERLRTAGFEVTVSIDEDTRRPFAEAEAERVERAEARAERFEERAGRAAARSSQRRASAHRLAASIPFGQPILMGHHSERRARRDQERIHSDMGTSITEDERAGYWAGRAAAAESYEKFRKDPRRTLRRLETLRADLRRVERWQKGESAAGFTRDIGNPETVAELQRRHEELTEEIGFWEEIIAKAEADGFKVWGPADFSKGDFARIHGRWFQVLRVNPKSVTVPSILNVHSKVVTQENSSFGDMTHTVRYDKVFGRLDAERMAQLLETPSAE